MYTSSIIPKYKVVYYTNNPQTGYYTKIEQQPNKTPLMRLPYELKVEPTQVAQIKCNAIELIRGKERFKPKKTGEEGRFKFFTGLQETDFKNWFAGNDYEYSKGKKILSLCLFHFNDGRLTVFYFGRYYIDRRDARERMIRLLIPHLMRSL